MFINSAKNSFLQFVPDKDKPFAKLFSQTQIFQCFSEEMRKKELDFNEYL
jgi:hypothetical protein